MTWDESLQRLIQRYYAIENVRKVREQQIKREEEFLRLIEEHCEWYNGGNTGKGCMTSSTIIRALYGADIRTSEDLKAADEKIIARLRGIGDKKFALIMTIKLSLE